MKLKYLVPVILVAVLAIGTIGVEAYEKGMLKRNVRLNRNLDIKVDKVSETTQVNPEELKASLPERKEIEESIEALPIPRRFILWTHDGENVMWGTFGRGYFKGKDNNGKYAWGIYNANVFAGFYDGEFFWGHYWRGVWKAEGLFGQDQSHGRYVTFPLVHPLVTEIGD